MKRALTLFCLFLLFGTGGGVVCGLEIATEILRLEKSTYEPNPCGDEALWAWSKRMELERLRKLQEEKLAAESPENPQNPFNMLPFSFELGCFKLTQNTPVCIMPNVGDQETPHFRPIVLLSRLPKQASTTNNRYVWFVSIHLLSNPSLKLCSLWTAQSRDALLSGLKRIRHGSNESTVVGLAVDLAHETSFACHGTMKDHSTAATATTAILTIAQELGYQELIVQLRNSLQLTYKEERLLRKTKYQNWWTEISYKPLKHKLSPCNPNHCYMCQLAFQQLGDSAVKTDMLPNVLEDEMIMCGFRRCLEEIFRLQNLRNIYIALGLNDGSRASKKLMVDRILCNVFKLQRDPSLELAYQQAENDKDDISQAS